MQYLAHSECFIRGGYYYGAAYYVHITVWRLEQTRKEKSSGLPSKCIQSGWIHKKSTFAEKLNNIK